LLVFDKLHVQAESLRNQKHREWRCAFLRRVIDDLGQIAVLKTRDHRFVTEAVLLNAAPNSNKPLIVVGDDHGSPSALSVQSEPGVRAQLCRPDDFMVPGTIRFPWRTASHRYKRLQRVMQRLGWRDGRRYFGDAEKDGKKQVVLLDRREMSAASLN
jgi:hypothetical protein